MLRGRAWLIWIWVNAPGWVRIPLSYFACLSGVHNYTYILSYWCAHTLAQKLSTSYTVNLHIQIHKSINMKIWRFLDIQIMICNLHRHKSMQFLYRSHLNAQMSRSRNLSCHGTMAGMSWQCCHQVLVALLECHRLCVMQMYRLYLYIIYILYIGIDEITDDY